MPGLSPFLSVSQLGIDCILNGPCARQVTEGFPGASVEGNIIASEDSRVQCLCRPQAAKHCFYDTCKVVIALSHHDGIMKATVVHSWQKVVKSLTQGCYKDTAVWGISAQISTRGKHKCSLNLQELGGRKHFGIFCCLLGRLTKVFSGSTYVIREKLKPMHTHAHALSGHISTHKHTPTSA